MGSSGLTRKTRDFFLIFLCISGGWYIHVNLCASIRSSKGRSMVSSWLQVQRNNTWRRASDSKGTHITKHIRNNRSYHNLKSWQSVSAKWQWHNQILFWLIEWFSRHANKKNNQAHFIPVLFASTEKKHKTTVQIYSISWQIAFERSKGVLM